MTDPRTVRCLGCDRAIDADARVCPHCGELQPTPILAAGAVVIGVFAFRVGGSGPELVPSLLLAGIVYPVVFGAIGAAIAYVTDQR